MSWLYSPLSAGGILGPTYTLTADYGTFSLNGQAAVAKRGLVLQADYGSFNFTGFQAGLPSDSGGQKNVSISIKIGL